MLNDQNLKGDLTIQNFHKVPMINYYVSSSNNSGQLIDVEGS